MKDTVIKPHKEGCEGRIHKKPGGEEHADGQQDDGQVGEHSRVYRAGISRHCLELLQSKQRQIGAKLSWLNYGS